MFSYIGNNSDFSLHIVCENYKRTWIKELSTKTLFKNIRVEKEIYLIIYNYLLVRKSKKHKMIDP
jgi:hypothetical protein